MAEVLELTQYVESHPDNYGQRWRLAKKLYVAWEYRAALEHLLVLKNEWTRKPNVVRYLAATYYRLSRYDESIGELKLALEEWPDELPIREQLARAVELSGSLDEAAEIWEQISLNHPEHRFAKRAASSLHGRMIGINLGKTKGDTFSIPTPPLNSTDEQRECPYCAARNSEEFERCWQCHSLLDSAVAGPDSIALEAQRDEESRFAMPLGVGAGLTLVALLSASVYLTLQQNAAIDLLGKGSLVATSLTEYFLRDLAVTRIIIGLVLLIAWPLALHLSLSLVGGNERTRSRLNLTGALLAALTYLVSWSPAYYGLVVLSVPLTVSFVLVLFFMGLKFRSAITLWVGQAVLVMLASMSVLAALHGFQLLGDLPILVLDSAQEAPGQPVRFSGTTPFTTTLEWQKSESSWLDAMAVSGGFVVEIGPSQRTIYLELRTQDTTVEFEEIGFALLDIAIDGLVPGQAYVLSVTGEDGVDVSVTVRSVHKLTTPAPNAQGNSKT